MKKLSNFYDQNQFMDSVEDVLGSGKDDVLIDVGFYLEGYMNPDGVFNDDEDAHSNGSSLYLYVDVETTFEEMLGLFEGRLKDQTLTISIIPSVDVTYEEERGYCKENLLSELLSDIQKKA